MASKYWLKLYHELLDDPKVARLNDSAYRRFIECLLLAGELDKGGLLPPLEDMSWRIRVTETALTQDMTRLALGGMVELKEHEGSERWFVSKFAERQAPSTSAKRVHEFRKRKRKESKEKEEKQKEIQITDTDTYCNVTCNVTPVTNRYPNVTDTRPENTPPMEAMSAIAMVVKETLAPGYNEDKFENAAHVILALNAVDSIPGFAPWWQRNSYYSDNGKPSIKSFLDEFQNYLDGVEKQHASSNKRLPQSQTKHVAGGI